VWVAGGDGLTVMVSGGGWWSSVLGGLDSGGVEPRSARDEMVSDRAKGAFYRPAWGAKESGARGRRRRWTLTLTDGFGGRGIDREASIQGIMKRSH
jgi:hypothetical protein